MAESGDVLLAALKNLAESEGVVQPSPALLKRVMRILGSSIASTRPDATSTLSTIKGRLLRGPSTAGEHEEGPRDALRFQELQQKLVRLGVPRQSTAVLFLLSEISENNSQDGATSSVLSSFQAPVLNLSGLGQQDPVSNRGGEGTSRDSYHRGNSSSFRQPSRSQHRRGGDRSPSPTNSERSSVASSVGSSAASLASLGGHAAKGGLRGRAVSAVATEQAILRDVLYAFQGIDGAHLKYSVELESYVVNPQLFVAPATKDLVAQLCEMGWLFNRVRSFVERFKRGGGVGARSSNGGGLMSQAFCASLEADLSDYYRLIAVLETQLKLSNPINPSSAKSSSSVASSSTRQSSRSSSSNSSGGGLTLRRLAVWAQDPMERLQLMATLVDGCGHLSGGALASALEAHLRHGDPFVKAFVSRTLRAVLVPLVDMVHQWVHEGELSDPHKEFFVAEASVLSAEDGGDNGGKAAAGGDSSLWFGQHELRTSMVPRFLPLDLAKKVLVLGKSLHFMRRVCGDTEWVVSSALGKGPTQSSASAQATSSASASSVGVGARAALAALAAQRSVSEAWVGELRVLVDSVGDATHKRLLDLMQGPRFGLRTHLAALKKFLFLGQGDFVVGLMDVLQPELDKPADEMYHHALTGMVDGALRASNAQFESADVQERLGVKLLKASPSDQGWEVFSLDYKVDLPLSAVIHQHALRVYRQVFHLLWRLKRGEFLLSAAWRQHMMSSKVRMAKVLPLLAHPLHECNLLRNRMWHVVQNLSNYMMFEVLEESWSLLVTRMDGARDLGELIEAHDQYLSSIKHKALLTQDLAEVVEQLHCVLDTIISFCAATDTLFADALAELSRLDRKAEVVEQRTAKGQWGDQGDDDDDDDPAWRSSRVCGVSVRTLEQLKLLGADFTAAFQHLIHLLRTSSGGEDVLRFLVFRLDFSGFHGLS